ncbi:hypothetical protein [Ekhidna sp.]
MKSITQLMLITGLLFSCKDSDMPSLCLEPPCGSIDPNSYNLTVRIENPDITVTNLILAVNEDETTISLDAINQSEGIVNSCWTSIPEISSGDIVVIGYLLDGEETFGAANANLFSSNLLMLEISDDSAILSDYIECSAN